MNLYIWRHNKTYHSYSMIDEPCVLNEFYLDALAVVAAPDEETALAMLDARHEGWRTEDLRKLEPTVLPLDKGGVVFTQIRGSIDHL
ncbi:MAG: DUF1902 domain-containing protein [Succiniclasticum sp.]|jgi:hypothetical protein